jgi:ABC-type Mn2+/Zn2+ transport system permease subunit
MSLDVPVFDRKNLKKAYYYFIASNALITGACAVLSGITLPFFDRRLLDRTTVWILIGTIFFITLIYSSKRKKELKSILEIDDYDEQFRLYERYYIKKYIWNAFSLFLTGAFFVITNKNLFFYMLLIQLGFSLLLYPYKRLLSIELRNTEIEYV